MIVARSTRSYKETIEALLEAIERRGLTVFARIDHGAGAREVGMELAEEEVVLLGNPRVGTSLMQSDPRIGLELPLRILLWREGGAVMLGYRDPRELKDSFEVSSQTSILEQMASLLGALAAEATGEGEGSS